MLRIFYRQLQNLVKIFSNWFFFDVDSKQGQSDLADNISKFFGLNLYFYIILFFCFFCVCCMIFNVAHFFVCYPSVVLESYFFPVRVILIFFCSILKNDMFVSWANYIFWFFVYINDSVPFFTSLLFFFLLFVLFMYFLYCFIACFVITRIYPFLHYMYKIFFCIYLLFIFYCFDWGGLSILICSLFGLKGFLLTEAQIPIIFDQLVLHYNEVFSERLSAELGYTVYVSMPPEHAALLKAALVGKFLMYRDLENFVHLSYNMHASEWALTPFFHYLYQFLEYSASLCCFF